MDLAREMDNSGEEAMGLWQAEPGKEAAQQAGWPNDPGLLTRSLVCTGPLKEEIIDLGGPLDDLSLDELPKRTPERLTHVELLGAAALDSLDFAAGRKLREYLPEGKTLIALAVELPKRVVDLAGRQKAECGASFQYANYQATREAFWAAHDLADRLRQLGQYAVPLVDLDPDSTDRFMTYISRLSDLRAQAPFAAATGLGDLGKNGMLMTPQFGPRQRLAFVVTSAAWPVSVAKTPAASPCPADCSACLQSCPVEALSSPATEEVRITTTQSYPVFARHETRCQWARCLGMVEGEGAGLLGWKVPGGEIPEKLDQEAWEKARARKDPIQVRCYQNPNHSDTLIERCLQACPLGKGNC